MSKDSKPTKAPKRSQSKPANKIGGIAKYKLDSMNFYMSAGKVDLPFLERFADEMTKYFAKNKKSVYINEYYHSRGVLRKAYDEWLKRSEYLKYKHDFCKDMLGLRRKKLFNENNLNTLMTEQYQYDGYWDEAEKRRNDMSNDDGSQKGPVNVYFENFKEVKKDDK